MTLPPDQRSVPESTSTENNSEKQPLPAADNIGPELAAIPTVPDPENPTSGPGAPDSIAEIPVTETEVLPGLPRLNYNLWNYKWKLFIVTFLLAIESSLVPIALFYGLWFRTTLSARHHLCHHHIIFRHHQRVGVWAAMFKTHQKGRHVPPAGLKGALEV